MDVQERTQVRFRLGTLKKIKRIADRYGLPASTWLRLEAYKSIEREEAKWEDKKSE